MTKRVIFSVFVAACVSVAAKGQIALDSLFMEATSRYIVEKPQEALNLYLELLDKDPGNATAAYQVAVLLSERKQFSQALMYAERACALEPENEWFALLVTEIYKNSRQYAKAAEVFRRLQELKPYYPDYFYEEANMYVLTENLPRAIEVYDRLEARLGFADEWTMQKYKLYMGMGNAKAARAEIERISVAMPGETKYLEMLAQMYIKEKKYKQALVCLKKVLEIKPDDPYIYISLADYYRHVGDDRQAFHALEKAVQNPALDFQTKATVLQTYYSEDNRSKPAAEILSQASRLFKALNATHPNEPQGFFAHAKFLILTEKIDEAIPLLERALSLDSSVYPVWNLMLYACQASGDTARLRAFSGEAATRFPEQPAPLMYAALAEAMSGNSAAALGYARGSLARNYAREPFIDKVNLQIIGDASFDLGNLEESLKAYESLFELEPDDPYVRNNYAYYLALAGRDLGKAEMLAAKLCKEQPSNPTFLDTYGWVLFRMGRYDKAKFYVKA
ncbi:MAG: tetratricopeptide repeat protein, partial [Bacteroidales bacterium]|nr:tetratricopeptide repeat protein [Bacteroidales bacterium]